MGKILSVLLMIVPYFLCGCGTITGKIGGWSIFSATATNWTVVNNTADARFVILLNGKIINRKNEAGDYVYVLPGQDFSFSARNFSDNRKEYCAVVKAYDVDDKMIGVTESSFSLEKYQADCETWVINTRDLQARK
ncbi:MAG: hypothetical protein Q7S83_02575 [bacterium]|nr:hypothetical protein [bacterium]